MINEGSEGVRLVQEMYTDECAEAYQKIMKSLNTIKSLKIEIDHFTHGNQEARVEEPIQFKLYR